MVDDIEAMIGCSKEEYGSDFDTEMTKRIKIIKKYLIKTKIK